MKEDRNINKGTMMAAGPLFGLVFVIALPAVGIAAMVWAVTKKILGPAAMPAHATFGWRPSESYLAGKKKKN